MKCYLKMKWQIELDDLQVRNIIKEFTSDDAVANTVFSMCEDIVIKNSLINDIDVNDLCSDYMGFYFQEGNPILGPAQEKEEINPEAYMDDEFLYFEYSFNADKDEYVEWINGYVECTDENPFADKAEIYSLENDYLTVDKPYTMRQELLKAMLANEMVSQSIQENEMYSLIEKIPFEVQGLYLETIYDGVPTK